VSVDFQIRIKVGDRYKEVFKRTVNDTVMLRTLFQLRYLNDACVADGKHQTPT